VKKERFLKSSSLPSDVTSEGELKGDLEKAGLKPCPTIIKK